MVLMLLSPVDRGKMSLDLQVEQGHHFVNKDTDNLPVPYCIS